MAPDIVRGHLRASGPARRADRMLLQPGGNYLVEQNVTEPLVERIFAELIEEITDAGSAQ